MRSAAHREPQSREKPSFRQGHDQGAASENALQTQARLRRTEDYDPQRVLSARASVNGAHSRTPFYALILIERTENAYNCIQRGERNSMNVSIEASIEDETLITCSKQEYRSEMKPSRLIAVLKSSLGPFAIILAPQIFARSICI